MMIGNHGFPIDPLRVLIYFLDEFLGLWHYLLLLGTRTNSAKNIGRNLSVEDGSKLSGFGMFKWHQPNKAEYPVAGEETRLLTQFSVDCGSAVLANLDSSTRITPALEAGELLFLIAIHQIFIRPFDSDDDIYRTDAGICREFVNSFQKILLYTVQHRRHFRIHGKVRNHARSTLSSFSGFGQRLGRITKSPPTKLLTNAIFAEFPFIRNYYSS